jgi:hypothetical protein
MQIINFQREILEKIEVVIFSKKRWKAFQDPKYTGN